ncbi:unnamed protein product [Meganyctiphanes norvegica]|uniref:Methyltransferase domain-containing protein n=1 Tax=Meganyctiphanes norvegica TaxID=48144 RepID=A0AAV2PVD6_MEGNR
MFYSDYCCWALRGARRHTSNIILGLLLLVTCAQHVLWTQKTGSWELPYVYDPPLDAILDPVWKMDSSWNRSLHSHSGSKIDPTISSARDQLLEQLLVTLNQPTRRCRKMLELGGKMCRKLPDGSKKLCLDVDVSPGSDYCLGYSFGVGNDFTFDLELKEYGCEVYAFDQDKVHSKYPRIINGVQYIKIRLGKERLIMDETQSDGSRFRYIYRPLDDIQSGLNHRNVTLDYLKMDIEGAEWEVFIESILKTDILFRTKQLALEFHLDDLRDDTKSNIKMNEEQIEPVIKRYQSVFDELQKIGFELAWFEPNFYYPVTSTINNRTFHIFGETLWLNPRWRRPQILPYGWKLKNGNI